MRCSYLEIYNEAIRDLLGPDQKIKLDVKEDPKKGIFVKDLTTSIVRGIDDISKMMKIGGSRRIVGKTKMNDESSRSHSIFTIYIENAVRLQVKFPFVIWVGWIWQIKDQSWETAFSRSRWVGKIIKNACRRRSTEGSSEYQSFAFSSRKCHQCSGHRQIKAYSLQKFKANQTSPRFAWRKH